MSESNYSRAFFPRGSCPEIDVLLFYNSIKVWPGRLGKTSIPEPSFYDPHCGLYYTWLG